MAGHMIGPPTVLGGKRPHPRAARTAQGAGGARVVRPRRYRTADTAGCAGDERRLASQVEHRNSPSPAYAGRAAASASLTPAMSFGPPTAMPTAPSAMRLTNPLSTLPAPTSKKWLTPCPAI